MSTQVMIIGGGPAGISAAIQLTRLGRSVLLFESGRLGGMLHEANLVENYPGFPKGVAGPRLAKLMIRHLEAQEVEVVHDHVAKLVVNRKQIKVKTSNGHEYQAPILVLATGTIPGPWEMPRIVGNVNHLIYRDVATLSDQKGRTFAVIGSGDAAFDYAMNLSRNNHVILCSRTNGEKSLLLLRKRVERNESIEWHKRAYLGKIEQVDEQLRLSWIDPSGTWTSDVDGLVAAVGRIENNRLLESIPEERRESVLEEGRLLLIGDVVNGRQRQTAIAVGDGMRAAMQIDHLIGKEIAK